MILYPSVRCEPLEHAVLLWLSPVCVAIRRSTVDQGPCKITPPPSPLATKRYGDAYSRTVTSDIVTRLCTQTHLSPGTRHQARDMSVNDAARLVGRLATVADLATVNISRARRVRPGTRRRAVQFGHSVDRFTRPTVASLRVTCARAVREQRCAARVAW